MEKVLHPGVIGLTNYRNRFNRPMYTTIRSTATRTGSPNTRRTINRYRYRPNPINPIYDPIGYRVSQYSPNYTLTATKTKKKKQYKKPCCVWIKGKKICKPKYCPKKRKFYRKTFSW